MSFDQFLNKLRIGDVDAIEQFVRTYESFIRRSVRRRIKQANLMAVADSVDLCQSVFGSFLIRIVAGDYELKSEQDLRNLLYSIAQNKFGHLVRREYASRRDRGRHVNLLSGHFRMLPSSDNPELAAQDRDLLSYVRARLTGENRELFQMRQEGLNWDEIAERTGGSAIRLRKRFSRALDHLTEELGFEEQSG